MINKNILLVLFIISCSFFVSCISRLSRPAITGYIYDYDNSPIVDCSVGETKTDAQGKFYLEERRTNRFLLTEMLTLEAPPVFFTLDINKEGYLPYHFDFFQRHGGGRQKGATDALDTIYIRRIDQEIILQDYIYDRWIFSASKNLDTLYGTNKNYRSTNIINRESDFQDHYNWGLVYKYKNKSPIDSSWSVESYDLATSCTINLSRDGSYEGKKIKTYLNPWRHRKEYDRTYRESYQIPNEESDSNGKFSVLGNTLHFDKALVGVPVTYQIDSIDRDILILIQK
ncbi:hypothetical protein [Sphingobacterium paucimobilis]|uniref:Lipoprotein n=1 Tax=Sphingobacterium paucimobilis HER1398 TaxID=1346330 RepID=U2J668_9SPHI|nr:hypothetical protein [Sphingobacterium paucimobilis]ERJ58138.1 hypothetical protein M472_05105 [Sphingobacterium paucimobilis HER1398]